MKAPYAALAILLIVIAVVFIFSRLPRIADEESSAGKLINFGVLRRRHLRMGVVAQFFYNGGQTAINSLFLYTVAHMWESANLLPLHSSASTCSHSFWGAGLAHC